MYAGCEVMWRRAAGTEQRSVRDGQSRGRGRRRAALHRAGREVHNARVLRAARARAAQVVALQRLHLRRLRRRVAPMC